MEPSNAWERAQEAITRAGARSDDVITPDTAVSPFDASRTTVIPHAEVVRRGPPDPDSTQRLPYGRPTGPPAPRYPDDGGPTNGHHGNPYGGPGTFGPGRPGGRGEPGARHDERAGPRVNGPGNPGTAPFPAADQGSADGTPPQGIPVHDEPRPWWKRIFGRR